MKTSRRDLWLMLVPVLILAGVGLALRQRQGPVLQLGNEPFRVTVDTVRFETLTPREVYDGYDTKLAVDLGHRGKVPAWWGKNSGVIGSNAGTWSIIFSNDDEVRKARDKSGVIDSTGWEPRYDKDRKGYTARYLMKLRHVPAGDEIRLRDRLVIKDGTAIITPPASAPPVWVDTIVRKRGQITTLPVVSRDSGFKLERLELDVAPPAQSGNQWKEWRLRCVVRTIGADSAYSSVNGNIELHDARGQSIETNGPVGTMDDLSGALPSNLQYHRKIVYASFNFDSVSPPPAGPLWIVGMLYSGDKWPMSIRVPFRDTRGKILLTPRSQPRFRVVSSSSNSANVFGAKEDGADTTVEVVVQAVGMPTRPIEKWNWEADYSQHVVDARNKTYWEFPLKNGAQPAIAAYAYTDGSQRQMQVNFHLNLSQIPKSAGRLTFKAEISADGSRRVPVSVVVRP